MITLAIDPSAAQRAGWATFNSFNDEWKWGHFDIEGLNFKVRCVNLVNAIGATCPYFDQLVCEWPMYYAGERGQIAAQQNWTINLAGIAMYVVGRFDIRPKDLFLYTAPEWKGTVPKVVTARRFLKLFGEEYSRTDHNTIDAIMMLVHHLKNKSR